MKIAETSVDLQVVGFIARESTFGSCKGCVFEGQSYRVCKRACEAAVEAGQPDCDDKAPLGNYIYVVADPRQLVLPTGEGDAHGT